MNLIIWDIFLCQSGCGSVLIVLIGFYCGRPVHFRA